ncbi:hypothetical protein CEUSTIGMA_g4766.t1 [Chlamydomonas eustigma]|uniref:glutathione-specific gamma-glutamylcyclotransferase n=1 Tax=Chlamydomonas eustigma TaxID=1157962 RepID=A0A250X3H3_9CHLO|nr:hypothetical protein CEUSTIGMA_g4766.t1 [Chlamydomonas eustigma]|eukprot:GAX77320.1 hypothetical protein CEUSTIGMA_g4766.t1 [Chlamydomonas eustigma]
MFRDNVASADSTSESVWIFGYGSLIWRPNFEFKRSVSGYIKGWRRVWWQGSTDHRGTPQSPGRTLTLAEDPTAITWGIAYELAGCLEQQQETLKYLEWREKQYDVRLHVDVFALPVATIAEVQSGPTGPSSANLSSLADPAICVQPDSRESSDMHTAQTSAGIKAEIVENTNLVLSGCLLYLASPDTTKNVNYLGPAPLEDIARQIATSCGPSGRNCDYLFGLIEAMRKASVNEDMEPETFLLETLVKAII